MLCLTMVFSCLVPVMADTNNNLPYPEFGVEYYEPTYYLSEEYAFSNSDWYYQTGLMPAELLVSLSVISPVIEDIREAERRVLYLVNIERASYGLAPLVWYDGLADVSRAHSQDMVDNNFFSHTGSDGSNVGTRLTRVGISHRGWAENIASARSPESAMEAWMNSPGHRANILQDGLTHLGVGAVGLGLYFEGIEFHVWTQKFIWGFLVTSVSITGPATHTLTTGQFLQLEASVAPTNATNRSVIWSSSNPAVATVTGSGLVSGVSAGNATIAVTTVEGGHVATVAVTVEGISVTGVSIDGADTRTLTTGYTLQLNANVAPANATNRSVIWSSSNPAVATVTESGLVSGVSAGNATIMVTTVDGGHVATVAVTVEDIEDISVTGVSIDGADTRTLITGYTLQLNANVAPANATNRSVIWSSNNPVVATVTESGLVSGVSVGNAIITVTTVDGGYVASVTITVEDGEITPPTGINITVDTNRNVTVTAPESVIYRAYGDRPTVTGSVYVIFPPGTDRNDITVNLPSGWSWAFEVDPDTGELIVVITPRANVGGTGPGGGGGGGGGGGTATPPAEPTTPGVVTLEPDVTPDLTVPIPLPFNDVAATAWYYNYVRTVWENSIFQGTAHNQFSPQMGMTRAMFVQALANLEGVDLTVYETASPTFNDLPSSAGHFAAVEWAAGQGIVQGVGNDNFAPNASITMEQMATMLYRYIQIRGIEIPASQTNTFADFDAISYWAVDAVEAIQAAGIITGRPNGNFDPRTTAIRAEVTAIFARFLNVIEEDITNIEEIEETEEVEEIDE